MKVVIKSKPTDTEIMNMVNRLVQGCGFALAASYEANKGNTGFRYVIKNETFGVSEALSLMFYNDIDTVVNVK